MDPTILEKSHSHVLIPKVIQFAIWQFTYIFFSLEYLRNFYCTHITYLTFQNTEPHYCLTVTRIQLDVLKRSDSETDWPRRALRYLYERRREGQALSTGRLRGRSTPAPPSASLRPLVTLLRRLLLVGIIGPHHSAGLLLPLLRYPLNKQKGVFLIKMINP